MVVLCLKMLGLVSLGWKILGLVIQGLTDSRIGYSRFGRCCTVDLIGTQLWVDTVLFKRKILIQEITSMIDLG
jgi:hypothetical protein